MPIPHLAHADTSDVFSVKNAGTGDIGARFDTYGRRRQNTQVGSTAVAAGAGAGTSPTVALVSGSSDEFGTVSVTAGSTPATGTLATVTFAEPYAATPFATVAENDSQATQLGVYCTVSTTALTIKGRAAGTQSDVYLVNYRVVGGA